MSDNDAHREQSCKPGAGVHARGGRASGLKRAIPGDRQIEAAWNPRKRTDSATVHTTAPRQEAGGPPMWRRYQAGAADGMDVSDDTPTKGKHDDRLVCLWYGWVAVVANLLLVR